MIDRIIEQEQVSIEQEDLPSKTQEVRRDIESLSQRLDRLATLETLVKEKYRKRLKSLLDQFNKAEGYQNELKRLMEQLKKNKDKQSILKKEITDLERHKKTIREAIKQVRGYEKSSNEQIEIIEEEQEILCQRVQDLMQMLKIAEQAELSENELETIYQRVCASRNLLEEHEMELRKRTIDLLFECYIPPRNKIIKW